MSTSKDEDRIQTTTLQCANMLRYHLSPFNKIIFLVFKKKEANLQTTKDSLTCKTTYFNSELA